QRMLYSACLLRRLVRPPLALFFFRATAPTEISTLSLHDALPISTPRSSAIWGALPGASSALCSTPRGPADSMWRCGRAAATGRRDRKSTRLNSSHVAISYAVFCLKKKKEKQLFEDERDERAVVGV